MSLTVLPVVQFCIVPVAQNVLLLILSFPQCTAASCNQGFYTYVLLLILRLTATAGDASRPLHREGQRQGAAERYEAD
jgi:hypothetical protein